MVDSKLAAALHTGTATPVIVWANPAPHEAWRAYINGVVKVRQLNSGIVQAAGLDGEWKDVD